MLYLSAAALGYRVPRVRNPLYDRRRFGSIASGTWSASVASGITVNKRCLSHDRYIISTIELRWNVKVVNDCSLKNEAVTCIHVIDADLHSVVVNRSDQ